MKIKELKKFTQKIPVIKVFQQPKPAKVSVHTHSVTAPLPDNPALIPQSVLENEIIYQRQKQLRPIETKSEYSTLLNEIMGYKTTENTQYLTMTGYQDIDADLFGLVPYCGENDKSNHINMWLTGRQNKRRHLLEDDKMSKIVRVLDYSLKALDKKTGKYKGIVYRKGFFNPITDKQYYSSSTVPKGAILHSGNTLPAANNPYSIIKLKNGHNIYEFQKQTNSKISNIYADSEREILIDRKSKFKLITPDQYSDNDKRLKKQFIFNFITASLNPEQTKKFYKEYDNLSDYVQIWEEI